MAGVKVSSKTIVLRCKRHELIPFAVSLWMVLNATFPVLIEMKEKNLLTMDFSHFPNFGNVQ